MGRFWIQGRCYQWLIFFALIYDLGTGGAVAERLEVTVRLGERLNESRIVEGDDVYLACIVSGPSSQFTEVTWHKDGRELATEARTGLILSSRFLVIQNVNPGRAGHYTCSATSADGEVTESAPFDLHIRHKPKCRAAEVQMFEARINETVGVSCDVSAYPDEGLRYLWIAEDDGGRERIMWNVARNETAGSNHVPDVSPRRLEVVVDAFLFNATLFCFALNDVGIQEQACKYRFTPRREK